MVVAVVLLPGPSAAVSRQQISLPAFHRAVARAKVGSMGLLTQLASWLSPRSEPAHIRLGRVGETAARRHLEQKGLKFLTANFRGRRGEIDLIFRAYDEANPGSILSGSESDCLVFAEVKTRTEGQWTRPASAVDKRKRTLLSATALCYLREIGSPRTRIRFDIVEVLLRDGAVREVRHLPNAFPLEGSSVYPV